MNNVDEKKNKFIDYLDRFEWGCKFSENAEIKDNHGSLLLMWRDYIVCDTSQCGNLVNPYQINDMRFIKHSIDIVRIAIDYVFGGVSDLSGFRKILDDVEDIDMCPITPGKWSVMFEYNGYRELVGEKSETICHTNSCYYTDYIYWVFAKGPDLFYALKGLYAWPNNNLSFSSAKRILIEMFDDYAEYSKKD